MSPSTAAAALIAYNAAPYTSVHAAHHASGVVGRTAADETDRDTHKLAHITESQICIALLLCRLQGFL